MIREDTPTPEIYKVKWVYEGLREYRSRTISRHQYSATGKVYWLYDGHKFAQLKAACAKIDSDAALAKAKAVQS